MSIISSRFLAVAIVSIVLGLAAMLVSLEAYTVARSTQAAPSVDATQRSIGQRFNWTVGEAVNVQGNLYAYLGYEVPAYYILRLAKWQSGWIELTYYLSYLPGDRSGQVNVTLSPYKLRIFSYNTNYVDATFFES